MATLTQQPKRPEWIHELELTGTSPAEISDIQKIVEVHEKGASRSVRRYALCFFSFILVAFVLFVYWPWPLQSKADLYEALMAAVLAVYAAAAPKISFLGKDELQNLFWDIEDVTKVIPRHIKEEIGSTISAKSKRLEQCILVTSPVSIVVVAVWKALAGKT